MNSVTSSRRKLLVELDEAQHREPALGYRGGSVTVNPPGILQTMDFSGPVLGRVLIPTPGSP